MARRKRCSQCNELKPADEVIGRQSLCEECESDMSYCTICDWWEDRTWDSSCRHVTWDAETSRYCGSGANNYPAEAHKASFLELLKRLRRIKVWDSSEPLLPALAAHLKTNNCWTFWHGPLIGSPPDLDLRYEKDFGTHKNVSTLAEIPSDVQERWGQKAIAAMQLGMAWLTSLDDKSKDANQITAKWILEFSSRKEQTHGL